MRIAILGGTGALGAALASRLAKAGHSVLIGSRDAAKAAAVAREVAEGGRFDVSGGSLADTVEAADICFLTVPYAAQAETLARVREGLQGKILVDATVPLIPPKVGVVQLPPKGSAAVEAAGILGPEVRVVSALQNIGAEKLRSGEPIEAEVLVAGDEAACVQQVMDLLRGIGLRCWHVGPLANAAASEALTSVLIQLNRRYKLHQAGIRVTSALRTRRIMVETVPNLPMFVPGDDLAKAVTEAMSAAGLTLEDDDVVVFAQKVVSKVEGRAVRLDSVRPREEAQLTAKVSGKDPAVVELMMTESDEFVRVTPEVVITRHRTGHVLANAGIDSSNVEDSADTVMLWPEDPNASARRLRATLQAAHGVRLAVIVSDSFGRAWRIGTTGTAIGSAGIKPLWDRRGESDLYGRELRATVVAVADEIAAAASLAIGEASEGTPVAIVRGAVYPHDEDVGIGALIRPLEQELFR